jgi:hypothetical protein
MDFLSSTAICPGEGWRPASAALEADSNPPRNSAPAHWRRTAKLSPSGWKRVTHHWQHGSTKSPLDGDEFADQFAGGLSIISAVP